MGKESIESTLSSYLAWSDSGGQGWHFLDFAGLTFSHPVLGKEGWQVWGPLQI